MVKYNAFWGIYIEFWCQTFGAVSYASLKSDNFQFFAYLMQNYGATPTFQKIPNINIESHARGHQL